VIIYSSVNGLHAHEKLITVKSIMLVKVA